LNLLPYLGQHPHLVHLLASQAAEAELGNTGTTARILLTHGSSHPASNRLIEALASQLAAITAYWSKAPNLEQQVHTLVQQGYDSITILPYFLFAGKTTDSIAQQVIQLAAKYPTQQLRLAALVSSHLQFTDVIANWLNLVQSQLQTA
ncbi:MAG: CbiX/SirB N-terminal domain-containing protein, partial [Cyanobacteriota bacterium SKYGB_h_bin112]|nr:CbiX/SirB N-terminal domain-containing protein [Cyanobacteriota bacterium SKYGB_h_bin112]